MAIPPKISSKGPADTTPPSYDTPDDARQDENAGKYPNYWVRKTKSGHTMIFDDSNGAESITIQHRGGSMIQFMPDGGVQYVSHNGQHNVIFGENRMLVTGAHDITIRGHSSQKVEGDNNMTVKGGNYTSVAGPVVQVGESMSGFFQKHFDVDSQSASMRSDTDFNISAGNGLTLKSDGSVSLTSDQSASMIYGKGGAGIGGDAGVSIETPAQCSVIGKSEVAVDGGLVYINCGRSKSVKDTVKPKAPNPKTTSVGV